MIRKILIEKFAILYGTNVKYLDREMGENNFVISWNFDWNIFIQRT